MSDHERILGVNPRGDIDFPPEPTIDENGFNAKRTGVVDLNTAIILSDPEYFIDPRKTISVKLDVSIQMALADSEPLENLGVFYNYANSVDLKDKPGAYEKLAFLHAALGDRHKTLEATKKTNKGAYFWAKLALVVHHRDEKSIEGVFFYVKAWEAARKGKDYHFIGGLARMGSELGYRGDPQLVVKMDNKEHYDLVRFVSNIAIGYALAGEAGIGLKRLEEIPVKRWEEAFDKAIAFSFIAKAMGPGNSEAPRILSQAQELVKTSYNKAPEKERMYYSREQQAEAYALLAEAAFAIGSDPKPFLDLAEEAALLENSNLRSEAYMALLKAKSVAGMDITKTAESALSWATQIAEPADRDDGWGQVLKFSAYDELFQFHLTSRNYLAARTILSKMKSDFPFDHDMIMEYTVPLLAQLGRTEVTDKPLNLDVNFCNQMP